RAAVRTAAASARAIVTACDVLLARLRIGTHEVDEKLDLRREHGAPVVNGVSTSHGFREETRDDEAAAPLASTASRPRAASASLTRASERACATGAPMSTKRSVCPLIDVMRRSGYLLGPLRSLPPSPRF